MSACVCVDQTMLRPFSCQQSPNTLAHECTEIYVCMYVCMVACIGLDYPRQRCNWPLTESFANDSFACWLNYAKCGNSARVLLLLCEHLRCAVACICVHLSSFCCLCVNSHNQCVCVCRHARWHLALLKCNSQLNYK